MNKLIALAVGAAGYGVLVGWAVTADYYDQRLKDSKLTNRAIREEWSKEIKHRQALEATIAEPISVSNDGWENSTIAGHSMDCHRLRLNDEDWVCICGAEKSPESDAGETYVTDDEGVTSERIEEDTEKIRSNLQNLIDQYTANPEDRDEFVDASSRAIEDKRPPYVISRANFAWDGEFDEYDKTTLKYLPNFRVVLDDDDEVVEHIDQVLGWRNLSQFGGESEDPNTVFIRNRRMMTDFEVVRDYETPLPLHVKYGMPRSEFEVSKAAGTLRLREEDQ